MKTIYFVRHGEAANNVARHTRDAGGVSNAVYLGGEAPLTGRGLEQAAIIAERCTKLPIDLLVASSMKRTLQTAEAISKRIGLSILQSDLFVERTEPMSLLGRLWDDQETQRLEREWMATFYTDHTRLLDGENFADLKERASQALAFLRERKESHILVSTHGFFMRMIAAHVLLGDFTASQFESVARSLRTKNTGLTLVKYDETDEESVWSLLAWNDHAFRMTGMSVGANLHHIFSVNRSS